MKVFTSEGIEKQDNEDVLVQLEASNITLRSSKTLQTAIERQLQIANLHYTIMNDTDIEEPG